MAQRNSQKVYISANIKGVVGGSGHQMQFLGFPEHVTVLIGISHKNRPVGGVIHQPFYGATGRTVWGVPGVGVRGVSHVPAGNAKDVMRDGPKIVVTRSHMSKAISETIEALKPSEVKQLLDRFV